MGRTTRSIELDDEIYDWIKERYKGKGFYWLVNQLLAEYIKLTEQEDKSKFTQAAEAVKSELDMLRGEEE